MKRILIIFPWMLVIVLGFSIWWFLNGYSLNETVKAHSGMYPIIIENGQVLLYYNNLAETLSKNNEFEIRFYKINDDHTWTVRALKPPFFDPQLSLYRSKITPEVFSISKESRQAVRWNYDGNRMDVIAIEQVPSIENLIPLIVAFKDFTK